MTWFGSPDYLAAALLAFTAELVFWAVRTLYRWRYNHPLSRRKISHLQVGLSLLERGAAVRTSGEPPHPAPVWTWPFPGAEQPAGGPATRARPPAGPKHRATTAPSHPARTRSDRGGPAQQPVDASAPDLASTGADPHRGAADSGPPADAHGSGACASAARSVA